MPRLLLPLLSLLLLLATLPLHAEEKALYAVEFSAENNSRIIKATVDKTTDTRDSTFVVSTNGFECIVKGFDNTAGDEVYAGFQSYEGYVARITTKIPIPQKINKVTLDINSIIASNFYTIKLYRNNVPELSDNYITGLNLSEEQKKEAARLCMGEFPLKPGLQTVNIEDPMENQYYFITFDLYSKDKKKNKWVTLTGRCVEFYAAEPLEVDVKMFEQLNRFEWSTEMDFTDAVACVDADGNSVDDALSHLEFTITPKEGATFASDPQRYTEEYMTAPYDSSKPDVTPLSLLYTSDSWLYDFPNQGFLWSDDTYVKYDSGAITAHVPCSGLWTVSASIPAEDADYCLAASVTADITVEPTFTGFLVNWHEPTDEGALQFAPWSENEEENGKYNLKNVRLDIDGFLYNIYYKIEYDDNTSDVEDPTPYYRKTSPLDAGYALYKPGYDPATDTVQGINLYGAKSVAFAIEKNGISTLDANPTGNTDGQKFEIKEDLVTDLSEIFTGSDEVAAPEWFTLQGVRISAPAAPGLYIERRGSTARKILVR